jgi:ectoine hydroxylase-related dioxygenase (phytanoyl-CoA dioxygenase family)
LNAAFRWTDHTGPFSTVTAEQAKQFDEDGYFVMNGVFGADEIGRVRGEIDGFEAKTEAFLRSRDDERLAIAEAGAITFTVHLVTRSSVLRAFSKHPVFAGICTDIVGPDVNLYWDQAVYKKPEKPRRFPWHQDNGYTYVEPQQYLTCWVALTDATEANGCPQVAPGLHRAGTLAHTYVDPLGFQCFEEPPSKAAAEVGAGGIVVFSSLTPHLTGPNTTDSVRKAYILQYAPMGATMIKDDGPLACDAADRQYPVVRDAQRVA